MKMEEKHNNNTSPGQMEAGGAKHSPTSPVPENLSYFRRLTDQSGVTRAVLEHHYVGGGTESDPYIVDFLPRSHGHFDTMDPMRFSATKRWAITLQQAIACLAITFSSTSYTSGEMYVMQEFGVSTTVATLGVSLFVLGFALGPLIFAPISEVYGRQIVFFISFISLTAFNAGTAGAPSIQALLIMRFFAGSLGSAPMSNAAGVIADMFTVSERGLANSLFAAAPFLGPSLGPIAGGFLGEAAGWRWIQGLMTAFVGVLWIAGMLTIPETYAPILLTSRAAKLSELTGKVYIAKQMVGRPKKTVGQELRVALIRPWKLLFLEPIVALASLYMAIVFGTLYLMFAAFPIVFQQARGWSTGIGGLAFLGLTVAMMLAIGYSAWDNKVRYGALLRKNGGHAPPEARLPPAMIGAVLLPIGLFWFAWTNGPNIHWIVPIIASGFFGAGLVLVFLSLMNYLIDSYVLYAASVLAANSVLRSLFAAAFPLFTPIMYENLGIHWASSVPAFLALACLPCPFIFYKYGAAIRARCKFASEASEFLRRMREQVEVDSGSSTEQGDEEDKST